MISLFFLLLLAKCFLLGTPYAFNEIVNPYVKSKDQLVDLFTKALGHGQVAYICSKLRLYDIYSPT
jgi:hypothetical protein